MRVLGKKSRVLYWFQFMLIAGILPAAAGWAALPLLRINLWSIKAKQMIMSFDPSEMPPAPLSHPREDFWRATQALGQEDIRAAISISKNRIAKEPRDFFARSLLGDALERLGQFQEATAEWTEAKDLSRLLEVGEQMSRERRWNDARIVYRSAWTLYPEIAASSLAKVLCFELNRTSEGLKILTDALANYPYSPDRKYWHLAIGPCLLAGESWSEAASVYRDYILEDPQNYQAYIDLGMALYRIEGVKAALAEIRKGIAVAPEKANGYSAIGSILYFEKRYSEAEVWLSEAARRSPDDPWIWHSRGEMAFALGNLPQAEQYYRQAISYGKSANIIEVLPLAYGELASLYRNLKDYDQALAAIETSISYKIDKPWIWITAGLIYEETQDFPSAVRCFEKALSLDPFSIDARQGLNRLK